MGNVSINSSAVLAANAQTVMASGIAGAAIAAGQIVYADPSDSYKIKPANAATTSTTQAPNLVGMALNSAPGAGQPITYATNGDVNVGNVLTTGTVYVLSATTSPNNGGLMSLISDLATGNFVAVIGLAISGSTLRVNLIPSSVQKP
jgi:hypothetical protein